MTLSRIELLFNILVLYHIFTWSAKAQSVGEQCLTAFKQGKNNFVLDAEESLKDGATFISSPPVTGINDCVVSCCKHRYCNLALMENGETEGSIKTCYMFNCLYKQEKVCRFVRKDGYSNYVLTSVFGKYLDDAIPGDEDDRPPIARGGQDRVVQPKETVTLNGIQSKDDKGIVKFQWHMISGHPSAIMEKTTFDDEVKVSNLSSGVYKFQLTVTDTIGQSDSTEVTVLVLTPEQSNHHCLVPKKMGLCRGSFPRYHYNAVTERCESFTFGGCKENRNNYLTEDECRIACEGVSVMPNKTGRRVPAPLPTAEMCGKTCQSDQFTCANGCCLHPGLECDGEKQCSDGSDENSCRELNEHLQKLLRIKVDEDKARCTEPPVTGPCRASFSKWFYDPYDQACTRFNFGGCNGNDNQFESEDGCMSACAGVTDKDVFARRGQFEYQESGNGKGPGMIIAVLLVVAIVVLLAVLGYCLFKGNKKEQQTRHQRMGMNGTHASTLEDTEKLVYNSTTKPI